MGFGELTMHGPLQGIAIESSHGALVSAPLAGMILFADEFRSYGPLIIIEADCGRDLLISGPIVSRVQSGDRVESGALIGSIANEPPASPPVVYYELRDAGAPINPEGETERAPSSKAP
jgi:septal ring factor EnvC (AmiA/AmiB activator)